MELIQSLLLMLLTIGGLVLVIVLVVILVRLKKSVDSLIEEIHRIGESTKPLIDKLESAADKADTTLAMLNENRQALTEATGYIRRTAENIYRLESTFQDQIEPSVNAIARRVVGLRRGIESFLDVLRSRR